MLCSILLFIESRCTFLDGLSFRHDPCGISFRIKVAALRGVVLVREKIQMGGTDYSDLVFEVAYASIAFRTQKTSQLTGSMVMVDASTVRMFSGPFSAKKQKTLTTNCASAVLRRQSGFDPFTGENET
jgi:hypothetical protein